MFRIRNYGVETNMKEPEIIKPYQDVANIRKALLPLVKEIVEKGDLKVTAMGEQEYRTFMKSVRTDIDTIAKAIYTLAEGIEKSKPSDKVRAEVDFTSVEKSIDNLKAATMANSQSMADLKKSELKVEGLESLRLVMAKALQGINKIGTDKTDPTDYMNVRLTDGKDFYNAISRSIATAMEGTSNTPFLKADGVTPARVVLNADGSLPTSGGGGGGGGVVTSVSGTLFANVVNYPTVQTVSLADFQDGTRVDIKPLGTQVVATDNGLVTNTVIHGLNSSGFGNYVDVKVNASGSLQVAIGDITGVVGQNTKANSLPVTLASNQGTLAVSGTFTSASGTQFVNVSNFPTTQTVTSTSGSLNAIINNFPSNQSVIAASGVFNANITNFPTQQTVNISNGTNTADVVSGDSGVTGLANSAAVKTISFTTTGTGAQTIGPIDVRGYQTIEVVWTAIGSGLVLTGGQWSPVSGGTFQTTSTYTTGNNAGNNPLGAIANAVYKSSIWGNWFQIAVSALTSGTATGYITLRNNPIYTPTLGATTTSATVTYASAPNTAYPEGVLARTTGEPVAAAAGQVIIGLADKVGKRVVLPGATPENFVSGNASATGTSSTSVITASSNARVYVTGFSVANTGTATSLITVQNGTGGPTLYQTIAPAGAGSNVVLPTPIATVVGSGIAMTSNTASTTVYFSAIGYTGA